MMKRGIWSLGVVVLAGLLFICVGVLTAADQTAPPDEIKIENQGYKEDKKGPVKLSHKKHSAKKADKGYEVACADCHHVYKDGKNIWKEGDKVEKCSECHSPLKKEGKVLKLNLAYHKNCKDCHKKMIEEGKKEAPFKKCNDCHEKK